MDKDKIQNFLNHKKKIYQKRITRLAKQERHLRKLWEREPGREDVAADLYQAVKLQGRYNALIDFMEELQKYVLLQEDK